MEILILLGLGFVFFNFFKPGKNKKQGSNKRPPKAEITAKTSSAKETSFHIINRIDTDISEKFTCRIDNTGSPWVRVQKKEPGGETWEYNVLTFKWKNKDDRLENQNIITKLIREDWNRLKEKHGWEIEGTKKFK
mgnify:CR=1 FL=1